MSSSNESEASLNEHSDAEQSEEECAHNQDTTGGSLVELLAQDPSSIAARDSHKVLNSCAKRCLAGKQEQVTSLFKNLRHMSRDEL